MLNVTLKQCRKKSMWYLAREKKEAKPPLSDCLNFHFSTTGYCNSIFNNSVWCLEVFSPIRIYAKDLIAIQQVVFIKLIKTRFSWGKWQLKPQPECLKLAQISGNALLLLQTQIYSTDVIFIQRSFQALLSLDAWSDKLLATAICQTQPPNLKNDQCLGYVQHVFPTINMTFFKKICSPNPDLRIEC